MAPSADDETRRAIHAVWSIESARLIAGLARMVRDVGVAEELAQDALVAALEQWPAAGVPDNPGAWLMATAKHHAINHLRRGTLLARKHQELGHALDAEQESEGSETVERIIDGLDDDVGDDLLSLIFVACHPVLSREARVALTLRLLGGLTTDEIARAFLVGEPTIAQRIVRAKRTLAEARVPFEVPRGAERAPRLSSVLEVIYLIFNEGYSASAGDDHMRPALCEEALRLGRDPRRARARRAGGARAGRADGAARVARRRARRPVGRAGAAARSGPLALGSDPASPRTGGAGGGAARAAPRPDRTSCRRRSRRATRARAPPTRPTGRASSRSTRSWRG